MRPYTHKLSALQKEYPKRVFVLFVLPALIFVGMGAGTTIRTYWPTGLLHPSSYYTPSTPKGEVQ